VLLWTPRVFGIAISIFLGLFAMDAFNGTKPLPAKLADFVIHASPAWVTLAIVTVSWHREWIGGLAFLGLGVAYAVLVSNRPDWILVISGPLFIGGSLFMWNWRHHDQLHAGQRG
jgi:hypothetical protein